MEAPGRQRKLTGAVRQRPHRFLFFRCSRKDEAHRPQRRWMPALPALSRRVLPRGALFPRARLQEPGRLRKKSGRVTEYRQNPFLAGSREEDEV